MLAGFSRSVSPNRWASRIKAPPETDQTSKLSRVCGMLPAQKPMTPTGSVGSLKSSRHPSTMSFISTRYRFGRQTPDIALLYP